MVSPVLVCFWIGTLPYIQRLSAVKQTVGHYVQAVDDLVQLLPWRIARRARSFRMGGDVMYKARLSQTVERRLQRNREVE